MARRLGPPERESVVRPIDIATFKDGRIVAIGTLLEGKPAVLVTVRGGSYAGTPREGWDHATGWMRRLLEEVRRLDLNVVESEFTLVGVNPALDEFKDLARQLRSRAEEQARRHGRALGSSLSSASAADASGRLEPARSE